MLYKHNIMLQIDNIRSLITMEKVDIMRLVLALVFGIAAVILRKSDVE